MTMYDRRQLVKMASFRAALLENRLRLEDKNFKEWATENDLVFAQDMDRIMSERDAYIARWMN